MSGLIEPETLGPTMMHEHLRFGEERDVLDSFYFTEPEDPVARRLAHAPVAQENLWWIRYNFRDNLDNLASAPLEVGKEELARYRQAGGQSIVEVTPRSSTRDLSGLVELAASSGLNVIAGAGYYVDGAYPEGADIEGRAVEQIAEGLVGDLLEGIGDAPVRCGVLGELGCSWPLRTGERKVLQAAALAQQATGVALTIHPGRNDASLGEIRDVLRDAGADLTRTIMGHMDRCGYDLATRVDILESGMTLEYDGFGMEGYYPPAAALAEAHLPNIPNDVGRAREIRELIDMGFRDQIVVSHDIHMKFQLAHYGGWGFGHFLRTATPLMDVYGVGGHDIEAMTVRTPRRLLTIV